MPEHTTEGPTMTARVLGTIDAGGITPKPAWHFWLHEWVVRTVAAGAFVVGSIATALSLYIGNASFVVERHLTQGDGYAVFEMLPYVWLVLIVLGIMYSVHAVHRTSRGYRWPTSALVGGALLLSIVCGSAVYASGVGESIDRYLLATVPVYQPLSGFEPMHWMAPEQGIVAGVVEVVEKDRVIMRDLSGEERSFVLTASTSVPHAMTLEEGMPVRVVGTTTRTDAGEEVFEAEIVRPFHGRGAGPRRGVAGGDRGAVHSAGAQEGVYGRGYMKEMSGDGRSNTQTGQ